MLAGAAAVDPSPQVVPTVLAVVLFLWTPPHFWSLAAAKGEDYAKAGVPMLPIVVPAYAWTLAILAQRSRWSPSRWCRSGSARAALWARRRDRRRLFPLEERRSSIASPTKEKAMANFFASLLQLALLIAGVAARRRRQALVMTRRLRRGMCGDSRSLHVLVAPALPPRPASPRLDPAHK